MGIKFLDIARAPLNSVCDFGTPIFTPTPEGISNPHMSDVSFFCSRSILKDSYMMMIDINLILSFASFSFSSFFHLQHFQQSTTWSTNNCLLFLFAILIDVCALIHSFFFVFHHSHSFICIILIIILSFASFSIVNNKVSKHHDDHSGTNNCLIVFCSRD